MMRRKNMQVTFVGAGPGDKELITVKGMNCLKKLTSSFTPGLLSTLYFWNILKKIPRYITVLP